MISFGRINPYKFVNCTVELEESYKGYMTTDNKILATKNGKIYALKKEEAKNANG